MDSLVQTVREIAATRSLLERVLLAYYPLPSREGQSVARKLLAVALQGATPMDWREVRRLAALPSFRVSKELASLREETRREIQAGA